VSEPKLSKRLLNVIIPFHERVTEVTPVRSRGFVNEHCELTPCEARELSAQALALEAEVERWKKAARSLYNEAEMQVQESYPILFYDVVAMAFYRATGIWPLGKSSPIGMYHELSDEERFNAFQEWLKALAQTGKSDG